jgi:hypothetical protein
MSNLNSRQRIIKAFRLEEPDRIPVSMIVLNTWFNRADEKVALDLIEQTDPIISVLNYIYGMEYEMIFGKKFKEYSKIIVNKEDVNVIVHTPKGDLSQKIQHREDSDWITEPLFKTTDDVNKFYSFQYEPFDFKTINLDKYIYWKNIIKEQGLLTFEIYDAMCMLYELFGPEKFYFNLIDNYDLVKDFTSIAEERIEEYVKTIMKVPMIDEKPLVFRIVGSEMLIDPMANIKYYDELVVPYDSKLIKLIHDGGNLVYEHMHGNSRAVLDRKIKMGADAMGPFESHPGGDITIKEAKNRLFGKACVYGNMDDMQVLAKRDKRDIRLKIFYSIKDAAGGGGYILGGTESSIYNIETVKSFILMSKISKIYGNYPINFIEIEDKIRSLKLFG